MLGLHSACAIDRRRSDSADPELNFDRFLISVSLVHADKYSEKPFGPFGDWALLVHDAHAWGSSDMGPVLDAWGCSAS